MSQRILKTNLKTNKVLSVYWKSYGYRPTLHEPTTPKYKLGTHVRRLLDAVEASLVQEVRTVCRSSHISPNLAHTLGAHPWRM